MTDVIGVVTPVKQNRLLKVRILSLMICIVSIVIWIEAPRIQIFLDHPDESGWIQLYLAPTTVITALLGFFLLFRPNKIGFIVGVICVVLDIFVAVGKW